CQDIISSMKGASRSGLSTAFLIAQVGAHAAAKFAERLGSLGLAPAHAGTLRIIQQRPGISQQALSSVLGILPSRLVILIDELEERGLVERRNTSEDRRVYALHLTRKGAEVYEAVGEVARAHDDAMCSGLGSDERKTLASLLGRIANEQGLT